MEVYREPGFGRYNQVQVLSRRQETTIQAFPDVKIVLDDSLG